MQKNLFKIILSLLILATVFFFLKKVNSKSSINNEVEVGDVSTIENKLPDDFHAFYNQFHTDSTFQMSRIIFPLRGIAQSKDTSQVFEEVLWSKEDWIVHRPYNDQGGTFEREFTNTANIISETISANGGMFSLEKRYAKLSGEWHLIFYQELLMFG